MATYYVATNGSNTSGDGSSGNPWATPNYAVASGRNLQPGDTVIVRPGTYTSSGVSIQASGSEAGGYITLKSEVVGGAKIQSTGQRGIFMNERSYIRVEGFEVYGASGGGIIVERAKTGFSARSHHIEIVNNISHDNGTQAIGVYRSDWVLIEGNTTYNCCNAPAVNSIVVLLMQKFGSDSTPGYRLIIRGNKAYENGLLTASTDSGGIMIDQDAQGGQMDWVVEPYNFPRLVENNISYRNGGPGIIALAASGVRTDINPNYSKSMDILIRNNTVWDNARKPNAGTMSAGIVIRCSGAQIVNNIAVADLDFAPNSKAISVVSLPAHPIVHTNLTWRNNLTWAGTAGVGSIGTNTGNTDVPVNGVNGNQLGVNPLVVSAAGNDYHLTENSPAVDAGTTLLGVPEEDYDGTTRTGTIDIGAFNYEVAAENDMAPNSLVAADLWTRGAVTGLGAAVALGEPFTQRDTRATPAPADWHGDTGNIVLDEFGPVNKTLPESSPGSVVATFSMEPDI